MGFLHATDASCQCRLITHLIEIPRALDVHPADLEHDAVEHPEAVTQRRLKVVDIAAIRRLPVAGQEMYQSWQVPVLIGTGKVRIHRLDGLSVAL